MRYIINYHHVTADKKITCVKLRICVMVLVSRHHCSMTIIMIWSPSVYFLSD